MCRPNGGMYTRHPTIPPLLPPPQPPEHPPPLHPPPATPKPAQSGPPKPIPATQAILGLPLAQNPRPEIRRTTIDRMPPMPDQPHNEPVTAGNGSPPNAMALHLAESRARGCDSNGSGQLRTDTTNFAASPFGCIVPIPHVVWQSFKLTHTQLGSEQYTPEPRTAPKASQQQQRPP